MLRLACLRLALNGGNDSTRHLKAFTAGLPVVVCLLPSMSSLQFEDFVLHRAVCKHLEEDRAKRLPVTLELLFVSVASSMD